MRNLEFWLIILVFLLSIPIIIYLKSKKNDSVIITDENFNKIDLIKLINREIRRMRYSRKELYNFFEIITKNLTKEEEEKK